MAAVSRLAVGMSDSRPCVKAGRQQRSSGNAYCLRCSRLAALLQSCTCSSARAPNRKGMAAWAVAVPSKGSRDVPQGLAWHPWVGLALTQRADQVSGASNCLLDRKEA